MLKGLAKAILKQTPYRVVRDYGVNRFQGIDVCLVNLRNRGFTPDLIIDGGAHLGDFSRLAAKVFSNARCELVEPQEACLPHLRKLARARGWGLHAVAFGADEGQTVNFSRTDAPNTGVHVVQAAGPDTIQAAVATLDGLFFSPERTLGRVLLKMDLQGYELEALRGGQKLLPDIEVILTEVSFFAQDREPSIFELMSFLNERGFDLYDIAALWGRWRDNRACQGDFIFVRRGTELLADTSWE